VILGAREQSGRDGQPYVVVEQGDDFDRVKDVFFGEPNGAERFDVTGVAACAVWVSLTAKSSMARSGPLRSTCR